MIMRRLSRITKHYKTDSILSNQTKNHSKYYLEIVSMVRILLQMPRIPWSAPVNNNRLSVIQMVYILLLKIKNEGMLHFQG